MVPVALPRGLRRRPYHKKRHKMALIAFGRPTGSQGIPQHKLGDCTARGGWSSPLARTETPIVGICGYLLAAKHYQLQLRTNVRNKTQRSFVAPQNQDLY